MILGEALSCLPKFDGEPQFVLKGGVALEMRLGLDARATSDLDVTFRREMTKVSDALDEAFRSPIGDFTLRRHAGPTELYKMVQFKIRLNYFGKDWNTVTLEVSPYEGPELPAEDVKAISLAEFGLIGPLTLPCMPLVQQVAQKIHGATKQLPDGKTNERYRDLMDILLMEALCPPSPQLRVACEETFSIRNAHSWPPEIVVYDHWIDPFRTDAAKSGAAIDDVHVAAGRVRDYIAAIAQA